MDIGVFMAGVVTLVIVYEKTIVLTIIESGI